MLAEQAQTTAHLVSFSRSGDGTLLIRIAGAWRLRHGMPTASAVAGEFAPPSPPRRVAFEASGLTRWDSSLVNFVNQVNQLCHERSIEIDLSGLPAGLQRLVKLAEAMPEKKEARAPERRAGWIERIGIATIGLNQSAGEFFGFLGEIAVAFVSMARGKARYRGSDLIEIIQQCGANALGIVTLISYLVGTIVAFMGAVQLQRFGAGIYVADLVAIGIIREMGAMMTGIIMAGRTGAAFAAQLGTMKVTQEIDALTTMGVSPIEFLVLPRVIALVLMMPLLCLYADFVGVLGGASVSVGMLGISFHAYVRQSAHAVTLTDLAGGLLKATVYGGLVAYAGCLRGFQCGGSSASVGIAATEAVVTGIVMIVVACGIFAVVFHVLDL